MEKKAQKKTKKPVGRPKSTTTNSKVTSNRITDLRAAISKELYKEIEFSFFAPLANEVKIAGCFTEWTKKPIRLKSKKTGEWYAKVKLKPGTYEYRFLVDGQWENDQNAVQMAQNEFGTTNCILGVS